MYVHGASQLLLWSCFRWYSGYADLLDMKVLWLVAEAASSETGDHGGVAQRRGACTRVIILR